jgi:hypothetical protein
MTAEMTTTVEEDRARAMLDVDEVCTPPRRRSMRTLFYNFCQCVIENPLPVFIIILFILLFIDIQKYSMIVKQLLNSNSSLYNAFHLFHNSMKLVNLTLANGDASERLQ